MAMDAEDRAGLYITVIFHLVVVIALLCFQLEPSSGVRTLSSWISAKKRRFRKRKKSRNSRKVSARGLMNLSPRAQELR